MTYILIAASWGPKLAFEGPDLAAGHTLARPWGPGLPFTAGARQKVTKRDYYSLFFFHKKKQRLE